MTFRNLGRLATVGRSVNEYQVQGLLMGTNKNNVSYQALKDCDIRRENKRETHLTELGSKREPESWFHDGWGQGGSIRVIPSGQSVETVFKTVRLMSSSTN